VDSQQRTYPARERMSLERLLISCSSDVRKVRNFDSWSPEELSASRKLAKALKAALDSALSTSIVFRQVSSEDVHLQKHCIYRNGDRSASASNKETDTTCLT